MIRVTFNSAKFTSADAYVSAVAKWVAGIVAGQDNGANPPPYRQPHGYQCDRSNNWFVCQDMSKSDMAVVQITHRYFDRNRLAAVAAVLKAFHCGPFDEKVELILPDRE